MSSSKPYKLPKVAIRMVKEPPLYSTEPVNRPSDAVRLVRELLQSYDREAVVIVNLDTRAKPINFNIVSVGTINASLAHPREIMKSAVLSNAASVMLIHNHPSGSIEPSAEDIKLTNNMYSVCKILEIPLRDHIIIGDHERYYSFAEHGLFRYEPDLIEDIAENEAVREAHGAYDAAEITATDPADAAESTDVEKNGKPDWMAARQQAIKEITEKLEQGVKDLFDSDKYREYLNTMSKFHNYSLNNTILIAMQKPEATLVAGYTAWQKNHDRHVLKGEKGIKILAPAPYKVKLEQDRMDPDTHQPVFDAAGQPVKDLIEVERPAFKVATVFDVSQTEGKEIPSIGVDELSGNVAEYAAFFEALKRTCPVKMEFEDIQSGAKGFYNLIEDRIVIKSGMSEVQTAKTAIHEMTHKILHSNDRERPKDEKSRRQKEVEAESVAYTVCQHYGIDTSDYSFAYVAGWSSDKNFEELKNSLETIRSTADDLITKINMHFAEAKKEMIRAGIYETAEKLSALKKRKHTEQER